VSIECIDAHRKYDTHGFCVRFVWSNSLVLCGRCGVGSG
jgi:hypothetical protein